MSKDYQKIMDNVDLTLFVEHAGSYVSNGQIPYVIGDGTDLDELINDDMESFGGLEFRDREISLMGNDDKDCFVIVQLIYSTDKDEAIDVTQCLLAFSDNVDKLLINHLPIVIDNIMQGLVRPSNLDLRELLDDDDTENDDEDDDTEDDDDPDK